MEIAPKYDSKEVEKKVYKKWGDEGCFNAGITSGKNPFSIVIPPPNVTGILHMGHALNNTIQDVLVRFKKMRGHDSLWMPGTDHAGIATQNVVEKELAKTKLKKENVGREEFINKLWDWTENHGSTIIEQLKKLGASCDWRRIRFTMDPDYSEAVKEVFISLYEKGLIYRGNYIINWCPRCKTALSDEEAAHHEIDGWLYYIKYPVERETDGRKEHAGYVIVATTRPETMLGDTAVAVNPDDARYGHLKDCVVILPIVNRKLTVIEDAAIDPAFGTGVVKVTPAHDPVDFMLGKKYGLEFINIMNEDATLNDNVPDDFTGMDRFEARQALLEILEEKKLIEKKEPYKISAGHCYRCHTIIEPRISPQWFVKMKPLSVPAIKAVEDNSINFYPERWKKVYLNWMNNIQDWCISRQIWWGHRIPVYYCTACRNAGDQKDEGESTKKGIVVSAKKPDKCPDCGSTAFIQDEDVLDTWFSSWLWPFATFFWPFKDTSGNKIQASEKCRKLTAQKDISERPVSELKSELDYFYPTSVLVTASEILFFWVARMIMAGMEFNGKIPFKDVIIHGTVRDARGVKMSKSLGNVIDPLEIIEKFGADALRFSLMLLAASGSDVYLSDEKFLVGRNFCNKIWNATRFIFMKMEENGLNISDINLKDIDAIDMWLLRELNYTIEEITSCTDNYRINDATKKIYDFFWHTFCDWYIEIVKDKFTVDRAKVLIYTLLNSMKLLHPVMPFITEEIFEVIKKNTSLRMETSISASSWPSQFELQIDGAALKNIEYLIHTIKEIRNIKADLGIGVKKTKLKVKTGPETKTLWENNKDWILRLSVLESIVFVAELNRALYKNDLWELNLDIGNLDTGAFLLSLEKKITGLENAFGKVSQKLNNEQFLKNAPRETVEAEKTKHTEISTQIDRLKELKDALQ